ncbi:MAG: HEAT repeat domain-containing protein [Planctomycetota bacterium]
MGLIDIVPDLDSTDPEVRFKAITALYKMGPAAAPAVPKLVPLLRDIDGVNVKMTDGSERMITIAERCSMALSAIGEPAAGAVVEELKKEDPVSMIHCVRALATPALAKRAPVAVIGARLMKPKVSLAMSNALCEVLAQILQSGDAASKTTARMSLTAGVAAGKVPAKYQGLVSIAPGVREASTGTATPAATPSPVQAAPKPAAAPSGWMSSDARVSEIPAVRPAPPPAPAPAPINMRSSGIDRPTSMDPVIKLPEPEQPPENLRGRTVERPAPPPYVPVPTGAPTATYQPEVVMEMQQRVPPFGPAPQRETAAAANLSYEPGDRFEYRHEVGELIKRGDKLKAVNLLRAKTGASLVEALKQVESWG